MQKRILVFIATLVLSIFNIAWAETDSTQAQSVIENWFAAMKQNDTTKAASYLAPNFVSIHTDGVVRNKEEEIALIKNLHMKSYQLSEFKFTPSDNIIVVTYKDRGVEKIDNRSIGTKPAGRMAVLQKQNDKWLILAYANLDMIK